MYGAMSALFFCVNVVCAALRDGGDGGSGERTWNLVLVRVLVNDSLFILDAVLLAALLMLLARHSHSTNPYLISKVCERHALEKIPDPKMISVFRKCQNTFKLKGHSTCFNWYRQIHYCAQYWRTDNNKIGSQNKNKG